MVIKQFFTPKLTLHSIISLALIMSSLFIPLTTPSTASAIENCDEEFYNLNNILFYNKCASTTDTCSTSSSTSVYSNLDYAGNEIFTEAQQAQIEANRPFYEKSAEAVDIPWQLIAALHGRESGFKQGMSANDDGPYQITSQSFPVKATYSSEEFQAATDAAAQFIKNLAGDRDLTDSGVIKSIIFAYNGKASAYVNQAKKLGFSDEEAANGEGSPYVMNRFDLQRDPTAEPTKSNDSWGQVKKDHGSIEYPANKDYGAFVYYSALTNGSLCDTNATSINGSPEEVQAAFTSYMNAHNETYAPFDYVLGVNGCVTLSSWYIGEYTSLTYGRGNGEKVVDNLIGANSDKGLVKTDKPVAPAIFSVAGGVATWGSSGSSAGHVGLVVSVNETAHTATVVHTGSGKAGQAEKAYISTYSYPTNGVSFVSVGSFLNDK